MEAKFIVLERGRLISIPDHFNGNVTWIFLHNNQRYVINGCQFLIGMEEFNMAVKKFEMSQKIVDDVNRATSMISEEIRPMDIMKIIDEKIMAKYTDEHLTVPWTPHLIEKFPFLIKSVYNANTFGDIDINFWLKLIKIRKIIFRNMNKVSNLEMEDVKSLRMLSSILDRTRGDRKGSHSVLALIKESLSESSREWLFKEELKRNPNFIEYIVKQRNISTEFMIFLQQQIIQDKIKRGF